MATRNKPTDIEFIRMYYEHQYERVGKLEDARLSMTNYVLAVSALIFTFGYKDITSFTITNGIVLPSIIVTANYFAMKYIDRTSEFMRTHKNRAHEILTSYAPKLKKLNDDFKWSDGGFWGSIKKLQKAIHGMVMVTAVVPIALFLYQLWLASNP